MLTGLINEFRVAKSYKPGGMDWDVFKTEVARAEVNSPESYNCTEVDGKFRWALSQEAREAHLVGLLSKFYADFYGPDTSDFAERCFPVLDYLSGKPSNEDFIAWIEGSEGLLEMDRWHHRVVIGGEEVTVYLSFWSLSEEGKVLVEELDEHLWFFEKAIRRMYADNPLGGSLAVGIG